MHTYRTDCISPADTLHKPQCVTATLAAHTAQMHIGKKVVPNPQNCRRLVKRYLVHNVRNSMSNVSQPLYHGVRLVALMLSHQTMHPSYSNHAPIWCIYMHTYRSFSLQPLNPTQPNTTPVKRESSRALARCKQPKTTYHHHCQINTQSRYRHRHTRDCPLQLRL